MSENVDPKGRSSGQSPGVPQPPPASGTPQLPATGRLSAFSNVSCYVNEEDLKDPAVGRLLLSIAVRIETELEELRAYRDRYYEADKRAALGEDRLKNERVVSDLLKLGHLLGGIALGTGFAWAREGATMVQGFLFVIFGFILISVSILCRNIRL